MKEDDEEQPPELPPRHGPSKDSDFATTKCGAIPSDQCSVSHSEATLDLEHQQRYAIPHCKELLSRASPYDAQFANIAFEPICASLFESGLQNVKWPGWMITEGDNGPRPKSFPVLRKYVKDAIRFDDSRKKPIGRLLCLPQRKLDDSECIPIAQAIDTLAGLQYHPCQVPLYVRARCDYSKWCTFRRAAEIDRKPGLELGGRTHRGGSGATTTYLETTCTAVWRFELKLNAVWDGANKFRDYRVELFHEPPGDIANLLATLVNLHVETVFRRGRESATTWDKLLTLVSRTQSLFLQECETNESRKRSNIIAHDTMALLSGVARAYWFLVCSAKTETSTLEVQILWQDFNAGFTRRAICKKQALNRTIRVHVAYMALALAMAPMKLCKKSVYITTLRIVEAYGNIERYHRVEMAMHTVAWEWGTYIDALADFGLICASSSG